MRNTQLPQAFAPEGRPSSNDPENVVLYRRNPAIPHASLSSDELALLDAAQGMYYGLNGPATRIWELLEKPRSLGDICQVLLAEFEVDPAECERDTRDLIARLQAVALVGGTGKGD
jgi:hypothetical protein